MNQEPTPESLSATISQLKQLNEQLQLQVAAHQRAEAEVRFLHSITQFINESHDFHSALAIALEKICQFTGWQFGEAWTPSSDDRNLTYSPAWYSADPSFEQFRHSSEGYKFAANVGLPGRVWVSKRPEWLHISQEPETIFLRKSFADRVGFQTALGMPIVDSGDRVLAVLVFFMFASCAQNTHLIELVATIAVQLGTLLQRQQAEAALYQSQAWLQAILDNSTALISIKDLDGKYLLVNVWFSLLFYPDRAGVQGKTDYDIFPPEIAAVLQQNDRKVIAAKSPIDWEELLPHEDDGLHTYLSIKFPLYNERGEPYAICGISTDITERKRAEDALRSSMATNRALLNAIPDLMFRINRSGIFVNFKAAKGDRLHLPAHEFLGKHLSEVFPHEIAQAVDSCIQKTLLTTEVQILECQLIVNDEFRDYELRIAVSAENEVMAIVRDITDRKRTEAEIRLALVKEKELGELKSRFVTMASHEFRTPLATILSSSELLEHYSHRWSEDRKLNHLHRIQTSVKHMTQLLNDVLLIGKAEAGKLDFKPLLLDLKQFCHEVVEEIQLTASDRQIIFQCHTDERITGMMDEKLLRHIFINLLSNAVKYSPADSPVNFELTNECDTVIFRVRDRGIGIPLAEQAEIFSSFHRASNVGNISGTGLGLAIVKKSIDLHDGKIAVESSVGLGTIFTVVLPLNKQV
ncbi:ATP-binding protein [Chroococcidiopsis sp [FACHB-1243]]|uniref:sensor histidine kinase n=1 Tax=Chroococcidiopsis sp. [FACHB-1243] TaxID=2692781 RepID=UPI0018EFACC3|nr:ATP-binding protein [Chroococcidiopsis sp. [FACHB-1243]]